ncbi:MAG: hypothetical protein GX055_02980 [Desulfovibrionales bacterium]|nr:hypothetical protein [Desulfovibrionales bacterium]
MQYSEKDLPVRLHDGEMLAMNDGTVVRWESNGEAKAVFVGDSFEALCELFPDQSQEVQAGGKNLMLVAFFDDVLEVKPV